MTGDEPSEWWDHDAEDHDAEDHDAEVDSDAEEDRRWQQRERYAEESRRRREREEAIDFLPFTLREASRSVDATLQLYLSESTFTGLSLSAVHLLVVARHPIPMSRAAERMRCSPQRVSQLAAALEVQALLDKGDSPVDRRARLVETTDAGRELIETLRSRLVVVIGVVADEVGEERLATLEAELAQLAQLDPRPDPWGLG